MNQSKFIDPGVLTMQFEEELGLAMINVKALAQGQSGVKQERAGEPTFLGIEYKGGGSEDFQCVSPKAALATLEAMEQLIKKRNMPEIVWWVIRPERPWHVSRDLGRDIKNTIPNTDDHPFGCPCRRCESG